MKTIFWLIATIIICMTIFAVCYALGEIVIYLLDYHNLLESLK